MKNYLDHPLRSVNIKEDYRCFNKGTTFSFIDPHKVTLLVGDQGCGKSTLLKGLQYQEDWLTINLSEDCLKNGCNTFYFDTESMNPRIISSIEYAKPGTSMGILQSHFHSHGETLRKWVIDPLKRNDTSGIIFLDEPESGLSIRSQYELLDVIRSAKNCQFIIATHSLILIQGFEKVLSLEHQLWMDSDTFIRTQKIKKKKYSK